MTSKIYVADLSAYNNGDLHGKWIDANQDSDDIMNEIQEMLSKSPEPGAEEWAIHDFDGFWHVSIDEHEHIEDVASLAQGIEKHGEAFTAYIAHIGANYDDIPGFEDSFHGLWDSEVEYAEQLFDDCYIHDIPENLRHYIDFEAFSRDLFLDGYYSIDSESGGVFVFNSQ